MKKILYVVTDVDTAGGLMSILTKKINYLARKDFSISIFSIEKHETAFYQIPNNVQIISSNSSKNFVSVVSDFMKFIKKNDFDTIITADGIYISWILPFITKRPILWEIHQSFDGLVEFYKNSKFSWINLFIHKICFEIVLPLYNKVVVLTEEDRIKWKLKNIEVIPNFHAIKEKRINNNPDKTIICLGRFQYQKGYDLLINIWRKVSLVFPDWELCYYGVEKNDFVSNELTRFNAPDTFRIMGRVSNLDDIYSKAYLNLVPSRSESFSLSILEAMCYGVPSVSFDVSGPRSIISNGYDGVLVEKENIDAAAEATINLIQDIEKRNKISRNCYSSSRRYRKDEIMKKWIALFHSLSY